MIAYNQSPKISVIVPMYNVSAFLKTTVDSILAQTYTNFELLLIDDCSSDSTLEIARSFSDPRIQIIENKKNQGAGSTRNRGIELAKTTYIAFCDADDIMMSNRLEEQFNFMELHKDIDMCGSFLKQVNEKGEVIAKLGFPIKHDEILVAMFLRCAFNQTTAFVRSKTFKQSGLKYKENHYAEDFDLWANAVKTLKFHTLPQYLMLYKMSSTQTSTVSFQKQQRDAYLTYEMMIKDLGVTYNDHIIAIHYELAHRRKRIFPKEWIEEYEAFCRECLSRNKEIKLYPNKIWQREIIHNYKKSQYLLNDKLVATLKTFFKFKI